MNKKKQMEKDRDKSLDRKAGSLLNLFKNVKFIVLNIIALVVLAFALISGDGKNIALNLYENITGQEYEVFAAVEDLSNENYVILKDKLLRDKSINIEDVDVSVFNNSATFYRYRVVLDDNVLFYTVEKKSNGLWHIKQEK